MIRDEVIGKKIFVSILTRGYMTWRLLATSMVPYILKPGKSIKLFYKELMDVTCLAHELQTVKEDVSSKFPQVDGLVWRMNNFVKAPANKMHLSLCVVPGIPLSPEPIIIRWTDAVIY
jgi:hypothetical protein